MRPRTKSVVNVHEYFSQDDGESDQEEDEDDHWMHVAMRGSSNNSSKSLKRPASFSKSKKATTNGAKRERTSTLESWEGTDIEDDDEEYDFDDDEDDEDDEESVMRRKRNERLRTCSHDRRISFDTDVNVVTIPARSSFDAEYKRRVWYSHEEYSLMRQLD